MLKKCTVIFLAMLMSMCCLMVFACKDEPKAEYYTLNASQPKGGTIQVFLQDGAATDGKFLSGSKVLLTASPSDGYKFDKIIVNGVAHYSESYLLTIISNTTVSAAFTLIPLSTTTLDRISSAFANTYDLSDYESSEGISGKITSNFRDEANASYSITTEFSFSKNSADSYFCTDIKLGLIPLFSVYYFDNEDMGEARLYFGMLGSGEYYYIKTLTVAEILSFLYSDVAGEPQSPSTGLDLSTIEMLEMLMVIYDIENTTNASFFSVNVTMLSMLVYELYMSISGQETDLSFIESMPQVDISVRVDYDRPGGIEQISQVNYTITSEGSELSLGELQPPMPLDFVLRGELSLELDFWSDAPSFDFNPLGETESSIEEIMEIIQEIIEIMLEL